MDRLINYLFRKYNHNFRIHYEDTTLTIEVWHPFKQFTYSTKNRKWLNSSAGQEMTEDLYELSENLFFPEKCE
ncbi:MAG: hypothetical protein ACK5LC_11400 [Coprobacillaceae bacterium]